MNIHLISRCSSVKKSLDPFKQRHVFGVSAVEPTGPASAFTRGSSRQPHSINQSSSNFGWLSGFVMAQRASSGPLLAAHPELPVRSVQHRPNCQSFCDVCRRGGWAAGGGGGSGSHQNEFSLSHTQLLYRHSDRRGSGSPAFVC